MERARRLVLVGMTAAAILSAFYASLEPLVSVVPVDFAEEQREEGSFTGFATEQEQYLRQLPLEEYIGEVTAGKLIEVTGPVWAEFCQSVMSASKGEGTQGGSAGRLSPDDASPFSKHLFFRPGEPPIRSIERRFSEDGQVAYLVTAGEGHKDYLRVQYYVYSSDDFAFGSGFRRTPRPPTRFLFPYRRFSLWLFLIGIAFYIALPQPTRPGGAVYCARWRCVLSDFLGLLLFVVFFGLPFFIVGGIVQAITSAWFVILVIWPLAFVGVWLLQYMAWYAGYWLQPLEDRLRVAGPGGARDYFFREIVSFEPVKLLPPKWLIAASWVAALGTSGSQRIGAVGRASILSGTGYGGIRLTMLDGSRLCIWLTDQLGNQALKAAETIVQALQAAGVQRREEELIIRAIIPPTLEQAGKKGRISRDELALALLFASPFIVLASIGAVFLLNKLWLDARLVRDERQSPVETAPVPVARPDVEWDRTVEGEPEFESVVGTGVIPTRDGGYLIIGRAMRGNDVQVLVLKSDEAGGVQWRSSYGTERWDYGESAVPTRDGGYLLVGGSRPPIGTLDASQASRIYVAKLSSSGAVEWERSLGEEGAEEWGYSAVEKDNGGYTVAGLADSGVCIFETDASGAAVSQRIVRDIVGGDGELTALCQEVSGAVAAAGEVRNLGTTFKDLLLVSLNPNGTLAWRATFGGKRKESGQFIMRTHDGGFAATGTASSTEATGDDVFFVRTDAQGNALWERHFGGEGDESGVCTRQLSDGGFAVLASDRPAGDSLPAIYLVRTDDEGTVEWEKRIALAGHGLAPCAMVEARDGGFVVTGERTRSGYLRSSLFLMKIKSAD
ncbi:MAG: hypothetical protein AB1714_00975 [Acidobacteriota bacterium]